MTPRAKAEASFRSEERLRLFVEAVKDYAIYTLDPEGRVTSWNQGAERIKGYAASEIIGNSFSRFFTEEDLQEGKPQQELQIAAEQGQFETEAWRVRKDGSRFWANVVLTAIKDDKGELIGFAKVTRDFTERMRGEEALRRANAALATKIIERVAAEEEARSAYQHEVTLRQNEESFRLFVSFEQLTVCLPEKLSLVLRRILKTNQKRRIITQVPAAYSARRSHFHEITRSAAGPAGVWLPETAATCRRHSRQDASAAGSQPSQVI